jgi:hypothetical protein
VEVNDYHQKYAQKRQGHNDPAFLYNLIAQASLNYGRALLLSYRETSPNPKWPDTQNIAYDVRKESSESRELFGSS